MKILNQENLEIKVGCDIVNIDRFKKIEKSSLLKIFHELEIKNASHESIAGLFAAKESCKKVFNELRWHEILIKKLKSGKPSLMLNNEKIKSQFDIMTYDISISHDGKYAISTVIFLLSKKC